MGVNSKAPSHSFLFEGVCVSTCPVSMVPVTWLLIRAHCIPMWCSGPLRGTRTSSLMFDVQLPSGKHYLERKVQQQKLDHTSTDDSHPCHQTINMGPSDTFIDGDSAACHRSHFSSHLFWSQSLPVHTKQTEFVRCLFARPSHGRMDVQYPSRTCHPVST